MSKELTIATELPDISLPGIISGCRMILSSENHLSISKGRFVTPTGGFAEIRRAVTDAVFLPENQDIVYITGSAMGGGAVFNTRIKKTVGREETVLAVVKILRYPVKTREDLKISHTTKSSNSSMSKVVTLSAYSDGETREWVIPWKVPPDHSVRVYLNKIHKEESKDYSLRFVKDNCDRRYTKIIFNEAPSVDTHIMVHTGFLEL